MTYAERQETGRQLCLKLTERIGEVAAAVPIDHWPPIADAPSAEFMAALTAWELAPSDSTMQRVSEAYEAVIEAWRTAAIEYVTDRSA